MLAIQQEQERRQIQEEEANRRLIDEKEKKLRDEMKAAVEANNINNLNDPA